MLLEFKTKNFKSFLEEMTFSMKPAPKQKGLDYSILSEKIGRKTLKGLCSSVIYGPNASGKTNIIGAMDVLRTIILRGNIKNSDEKDTPNAASAALELIPNNSANTPVVPTEFYIKFIENKLLFEYKLHIDLGSFLDVDYKRSITFEELKINDEMIFSRKDKLTFGSFKAIKTRMMNTFEENKTSAMVLAAAGLNSKELFITSGFKLMFSPALVEIFLKWFEEKFLVIYRADAMELKKFQTNPKNQTVYVDDLTNDAAKVFGINSNGLGYIYTEEDRDGSLCSIFSPNDNNKVDLIPAELFESYGTIRFINIFPLIADAIKNGGTLIIDEFDASIHPMALMSIVNIFHNDEINKNHAQLIFNTHNPIFLNSNLFRRDEIKFVERDENTNLSISYALSDFGTSGEKGVRLHEDYMNNYFISRYGAIKDVDFSSIFEKIMNYGE